MPTTLRCKVFSATRHQDREKLGEVVSEWLSKQSIMIVDKVVSQSSDSEFHCVTITIWYEEAHHGLDRR